MKRSLTLVMATLLFVALGCSLDSLTRKKDDVPTPVPDTSSSSDSGSTGTTDTTSSTSGSISIANFNKIDLGMSYDQVKGVMGSDGNETSRSKIGNYESVSYEWKGDRFARISVRLRNGELVYKSQSGITGSTGSADINQEKFNKINTGMSLREVRDIIGSDGEMTSLSKIGNNVSASFRWKGARFANIFANFRNDKLTNKTQRGLK